MSIRQCKNKSLKDVRYAVISLPKNMHKAHRLCSTADGQSEVPKGGHNIWKPRQMRAQLGGQPDAHSWGGGFRPLCRVQVGTCWLCWTRRSPWPPIPSCSLGWGAGCRAASGPHSSGRDAAAVPAYPSGTEDQEGSLATLRWIQASAETFFHCLTPPAGELTQRKVRAGPRQGSVLKRKELYWKHGQEYRLGPIYFCQDCNECGKSFNVFTGSGISFVCPDMNTGEYQMWHRVQQLIAKNKKEKLPRIIFICSYEKPFVNSLLFWAYCKCLFYLGEPETKKWQNNSCW